jgi:hypothetical protein
MTFSDEYSYPKDHPLSADEAKRLIAGELGWQLRRMIAASCSPLYWYGDDGNGRSRILHNGTVTYVRGNDGIIGITACHVIDEYLARGEGCLLQIGNAAYDLDLIDKNRELDIASMVIPEAVIRSVGKDVMAVSLPRHGDVPQEGRGIMLGGFPGLDRIETGKMQVAWGLFTAIGIARRVNERQITWVPDHEHNMEVEGIPDLPLNKELGGISGGPVIAWFEKAEGLLSYCSLAGIIVQANSDLELVVARRSEFIKSNGKLANW